MIEIVVEETFFPGRKHVSTRRISSPGSSTIGVRIPASLGRRLFVGGISTAGCWGRCWCSVSWCVLMGIA